MKIKQAMRYQLHDMVKSSMVFYLVILAIYILTWILTLVLPGEFTSTSSSADMSTAIFLFVLGLNMFKMPFRLMLQNGISRRTQVAGFALSALLLAVAMALVNMLLTLLPGQVGYSSNFAMFYSVGRGGMSWTDMRQSISVLSVVWNATNYLATLTLGYFLTTLYYRMSKPLKVGVSIGVPVLLFIVLPLLEVFIPGFTLLTLLIDVVSWCLGLGINAATIVPWRAVGTFCVFSAVMMGLSYLLARRATLKAG